MDIKEALAELIKDVSRIEADATAQMYNDLRVDAKQYYNGRYEVSYYVKIKLLDLIKLIPVEQITYYVLKETDTFEDLLKRSAEHDKRRSENTGNERSDTQED